MGDGVETRSSRGKIPREWHEERGESGGRHKRKRKILVGGGLHQG